MQMVLPQLWYVFFLLFSLPSSLQSTQMQRSGLPKFSASCMQQLVSRKLRYSGASSSKSTAAFLPCSRSVSQSPHAEPMASPSGLICGKIRMLSASWIVFPIFSNDTFAIMFYSSSSWSISRSRMILEICRPYSMEWSILKISSGV